MIVDTLTRCAEYAQRWCMDALPLYYLHILFYVFFFSLLGVDHVDERVRA